MTDIRAKSSELLSSTLSALTTQASATERAAALEAAVFEKHGQNTDNAYRQEIRTLSLDLGKNNPQLGGDYVNGHVSLQAIVQMDTDAMKSNERADQDSALKEQGLREAIGQSKIPVHETGGFSAGPAAATNLSQDGEISAQEASMGEGEFKARAQPKIQGLEGIEFETNV